MFSGVRGDTWSVERVSIGKADMPFLARGCGWLLAEVSGRVGVVVGVVGVPESWQLRLPLAPAVGLAAGIVAIFLVTAALPALRAGPRQCNEAPAEPAAGEVSG